LGFESFQVCESRQGNHAGCDNSEGWNGNQNHHEKAGECSSEHSSGEKNPSIDLLDARFVQQSCEGGEVVMCPA
jgi:hypothetical protein